MTREILRKLDRSLNSKDEAHKILIGKRGYYIYFNEPNKKDRIIKIHKHFCGECCWGKGKIKHSSSGRNGIWIGPFSNINFIKNFTNIYFKDYEFRECSCTKLT